MVGVLLDVQERKLTQYVADRFEDVYNVKLKVLASIFKWLDEGYTPLAIANWSGINPDVIDSINELRKIDVDLELFA